ncbi:MAG: DUF3465 domain-containing protein [Desulfopila sp.]|jgi:hypothetical protein|nr:DUF3465 domain-containing protein [Desulfopila sp.]
MKKKLPLFTLVLLILFFAANRLIDSPVSQTGGAKTTLEEAVAQRLSDTPVSGSGVVIHLLSDDTKGSRHQRFIVQVDHDLTLLIVHNIDIAPRIDSLQKGDKVNFKGEYVWNNKGGLIHWTHHDPAGKNDGGWIQHQGTVYQ